MKKIAFLLTSLCYFLVGKTTKKKNNFITEDNAPIDTTLVDSVVGQLLFRR